MTKRAVKLMIEIGSLQEHAIGLTWTTLTEGEGRYWSTFKKSSTVHSR